MIKHGFLEKDIEPSQVHDTIKDLLKKENFAITSDDSGNMMWEIHAKKSSRERIIFGRVRDVDTGDSLKNFGIWNIRSDRMPVQAGE